MSFNVRSADIEVMRIRSRLKTRRADILIEGSLYTRQKRPSWNGEVAADSDGILAKDRRCLMEKRKFAAS